MLTVKSAINKQHQGALHKLTKDNTLIIGNPDKEGGLDLVFKEKKTTSIKYEWIECLRIFLPSN